MNTSDNLLTYFPHIRELDFHEYYETEPYIKNKYRRCKTFILLGALCNYEKFRLLSNNEQNIIVREIEFGCVNETIKKMKENNIGCSWQTEQFTKLYSTIIQEKAMELDWNQNTWLIPKILSGEISTNEVASLQLLEVNQKEKELVEKIAKRKEAKVMIKYVTSYECPQCGEHKCTIKSLQLRGQDEGATIVAFCICGYEWTIDR